MGLFGIFHLHYGAESIIMREFVNCRSPPGIRKTEGTGSPAGIAPGRTALPEILERTETKIMSASREKKNRQVLAGSAWSDPRTAREAQQRKEQKRSSILYGAIAAVFVVVAVITLIWKSNIIQKTATAAVIDGEKYTAADVTFFYQNVYRGFINENYYALALGYMGLDPQAPLAGQTMTEADAAIVGATAGDSWEDYFVGQALEQMAAVQAALADAKANNFVYPDSVQAQYEAQMASLQASAQASGISLTQYLRSSLGGTMTEKIYGEHLLHLLQYSAYEQAYKDGLTYTDEELEAAYKEKQNTYDKADYEYVLVNGTAATTTDADGNTVDPTEEEEEAAKAAAKEIADEIYAAYQEGKDLKTLADDYDNANYTNVEAGTYASSTLMDWVFDGARTSGEDAVLENDSSYYVVVFHNRTRDEYNTVAVRHILATVDESGLDEESETYESELRARKDAAKAKAEELLAKWQSGEATEDAFAALANAESQDGGSNTTGGLYSQFPQGQMVPEFNDWCFDAARKPGDTGIVYGESANYKGYHVMYFVGQDLPYWKVQVSTTLKDAAAAEWSEQFTKDHAIDQGSGIKYVG